MIEVHYEIVAALNNLIEIAKIENKTRTCTVCRKTQVTCKEWRTGFTSYCNTDWQISEVKV